MKGLFKLVVLLITVLSQQIYSQIRDIPFLIENYTDSIINTTLQPGVIVSYTCGDSVIYEKAKGVSNINSKEPMDLKMKWRIGSLTKTFTITVLLQLVDEGLLNLDDAIDKYFPNIPNGENITVRMLGNMSSGLSNYTNDLAFSRASDEEPKRKWKPEELVEFAISNPPDFEPGKGYEYCNTNTILIGMLIEKLTGKSITDEIKIRIFDRLGLNDTYLAMEPELNGYYSHGYNDNVESLKEPIADVTNSFDPSWSWAAGGIVSTIADLKIYLKALAEGSMISSEMQKERLKWSMEDGKNNWKYGFGIMEVANNYLGHSGSTPGFSNFSVHSPETNCTIIIFYNSQSNLNPFTLLTEILK